jgi:predicted nuclease of predicted toxin-antitoxin system
VNFLVDAQLPPALACWIADRGHQAVHVAKLGMAAVDDGIIWDYARKNQAVIISKDEDFADRWLLNNEGVALVWIRKGNSSTEVLIAWFEPFWPETPSRLEQGETFIELWA